MGLLPGKANYLIGNDPSLWRTGIPTYRMARFRNVYPRIDLEYYGKDRSLEYDLVVRPGGDPGSIRLTFEGAVRMRKLASGDLSVRAGKAEIVLSKPFAYQETRTGRKQVPASWKLARRSGAMTVASLAVGPYDRSRALIIDPVVKYSTYLGGGKNDDCLDIDVFKEEAYVTGATASLDFPFTPGALQPVFLGGNMDAFVTRFDAAGGNVIYSTYLGTQSDEMAFSIRVDDQCHAHVCGFTDNPAFPVTPGCYDPTYNGGGRDAFVSVLNPSGSALVYSTFIGGNGNDEAREIRIMGGGGGSAFWAVCGGTDSGDYPTTIGCFDPTPNGSIDAVFTMIRSVGQGAADLLYSTYIGTQGVDLALCMDVDAMGRAHIGGITDTQGFPTSMFPFQPFFGGTLDGFVFTLSPQGLGALDMLYSSYLGGDKAEEVRGIAFDAVKGYIVAVGCTESQNFPTTPGVLQPWPATLRDAFVSVIAPLNGGPPDLRFSTYLGGQGDDVANDCDVDQGEPYVVGTTTSSDFRVTISAPQSSLQGPSDGFIVRLTPSLSALQFSTFWGGEAGEEGMGIRLDLDASAYACGWTDSKVFPVTSGAFQPLPVGNRDGWVSKLGIGRATDLYVLPASGRIGETVTLEAQLTYSLDGSPVPGKPIDFLVDGNWIGAATTNAFGRARCSHTIWEGSGAGTRTMDCSFVGDASAGPSSGSGTLTVLAAPTSLYVPDRTGNITEPVELRGYLRRTTDLAWVVGRTVAFSIDGTFVGNGVTASDGKASFNWVITAGATTRTIGATFAGDAAYTGCSGSGTLTCLFWDTKMWTADRTARITDRTELKSRLLRSDNVPLYNTPVDFYVDGTFIITRPTNTEGYATYPYYDVPDGSGAGSRTILGSWVGNAGYGPSSKSATLTVLKALPYIWVLPRKVPQGAIANLYAYFRRLYDYQRQEDKPVRFKVDGTTIAEVRTGTVLTGEPGVARYFYNTSGLSIGSHTVRVEFDGDAWVDSGYGEATLTIL